MTQIRIIDTHCHLENAAFTEDLEGVISRAANNGIYIISSSIEKDTWLRGLEIAGKHLTVYASIGLDPSNYRIVDSALECIRKNHENLVAVGETGLDHFIVRDHDERDDQEIAFRKMISIAQEFDLPIQIHSRSAGAKALQVLESCDIDDVHMHAFDGKASLARQYSKDLGYYYSIPTSVVHSPQKRKLVKAVDIDHLLLETDSPVLGPEKGERNEPAHICIALQEVALILKRDSEELREIILENTLRLYRRIRPD